MRSADKKRISKLKIAAFAMLLLLIAYSLFCGYAAMIRTVRSVAQSEMEEVANQAIHNAIRDASVEDAAYSELVNIYRNESGAIESLTLNSQAANRLKSDIALKVLEYLNDSDKYEVAVPMGNFLGSEFFWGFGPKITFKIIPFNIAYIDFESKFTQAGINQVLHTVSVRVDVNIGALLPGFEEISNLSSSAVVSEAVIIGDVPETYLNIEK